MSSFNQIVNFSLLPSFQVSSIAQKKLRIFFIKPSKALPNNDIKMFFTMVTPLVSKYGNLHKLLLQVTFTVLSYLFSYLCLIGVLNFRNFFCHVYVESLKVWQRIFKFYKDLNISGVSGFSFCATESIPEDGNDRKCKKPHSSDK